MFSTICDGCEKVQHFASIQESRDKMHRIKVLKLDGTTVYKKMCPKCTVKVRASVNLPS